MVIAELSTRHYDGQFAVVALRGELDVTDAADIAASLALIAASKRTIIVDLQGLEFIDSSGLAALTRARQHARHAGSDLLLAAPQQQVLRMLALTRLTDLFAVHACVQEAVSCAVMPAGTTPAAGNPELLAMTWPPEGTAHASTTRTTAGATAAAVATDAGRTGSPG